MAIVRLYETYLKDAESLVDARFASLSGSHVAEPHRLQRGAKTLAYDLGMDHVRSVSLSQLPAALTTALINRDPDAIPGDWDNWLNKVDQAASDTYGFAEYCSFAAVIPFEASPVELGSIASIATSPSPVGISAVVAYAMFGLTPLLLVGVPAAMIVCGAAAGVSRALNEGLYYRMLEFLTHRTKDEVKSGEAALEARLELAARRDAEPELAKESERKRANLDEEAEAQAEAEREAQRQAKASKGVGAQPADAQTTEAAQQEAKRATRH